MALFVPFLVLPAILWWAIPLSVLGYGIWRWKPGTLGRAIIVLVACWPRTTNAIFYGNTDMWVAAAVAGGLLLGWSAAPIVLLKPTFLPLALIGASRRVWWVAAAASSTLIVLMLPLWLDWLTAMGNIRGVGWHYSLLALPLAVLPVLVWLTRPSGASHP
jgi:hypothetical protein